MDLRSLAAFRAGVALLLLLNLLLRARDLSDFYTDAGVIPRESLAAFRQSGITPWSLYSLSGDMPWVAFLFLVSAATAIVLGLGWRTQASTALSWILLISLEHRNPLVLTGGDLLLQLLLFWSIFLPLGEVWSIDARRLRPSTAGSIPRSVFSVASAALLVQVAIIYPVAALFKWREPIWRSLEAFGAAMQVDGVATAFGEALAAVPDLAPVISGATLVFEAFAWGIAFCPWQTARFRIAAVAIFSLFHLLGPGATMRLGYFPLVMVVAWVPFLPALFWERCLGFAAGRSASAALEDSDLLEAGSIRAPASVNAVVAALLLIVGIHLGHYLGWVDRSGVFASQIVRPVVALLGLEQRWSLWSLPPTNRYFLITAQTEAGLDLDVRQGGAEVDWNAPPRRSRNSIWWKLELGLSSPSKARLRGIYGCYWLRVWRREHPGEPPPVHVQGWILEGDWEEVISGRGQRNLLWTAEAEADWRRLGVTRDRVYPCQGER
ncbi:MAG: HTTM domain-containing protein [Myxococcota bacterium]